MPVADCGGMGGPIRCHQPSCAGHPEITGKLVGDAYGEVIPGGAKREDKGADYSQITYEGLRALAETNAEGAAKYGIGNWRKGLPLSNLLSHAMEHILLFQNGDISENHIGHAMWNLDKAAYFIAHRPDLIDIQPLKDALHKQLTDRTL